MSSARERTRERLANTAPTNGILRKLRAASYSFGGTNWQKLFEYHDSNYDGTLSFEEFKNLSKLNILYIFGSDNKYLIA